MQPNGLSKHLICALLFITFCSLSSAFQDDEAQALQTLHDQVTPNWRTNEFSLHTKDLLLSLINRKAQLAYQIQEQLKGPIEQIQKAEQEFMQASQATSGDANQQANVDAKFQALTALQNQYDQQIQQQSRALQLLGIESELAEDLLLRNYALESCLLRRDVLGLKLKQQGTLTTQDLQDEKRSLTLTQEEIQSEQNLTGEAIVQQQEKYCGKRAEVLHQSLATLLAQQEQQRQASLQQGQPAPQQ
mmetsp:Transcript_5442/g.20324  ORF Transcript_5442/g.20324 Transcript_5442/m.20324 type:complete len:246 (-) Transcript_5442:28-765(-)